MSLPVLTAEYAAALAELGAAALDERAKRAAALGLGVMATSGEHWLDGGAYRPGTESQCLSARAAWRAANVRTEKAVDRLEAAVASFLPAATAAMMTAGVGSGQRALEAAEEIRALGGLPKLVRLGSKPRRRK